MSTRALYSFKGDEGDFNVYKHHDGYPSGAAQTIKTAINWFAWGLPRYESDEFAAAFCAAGKFGSFIESADDLIEWAKDHGPAGQYRTNQGGGVRLMPSGDPTLVACSNCGDIAYRYEISMGTPLPKVIEGIARKKAVEPQLLIKAFTGNWWNDQKNPIGENTIFDGTFDQFFKWAMKKDKAA